MQCLPAAPLDIVVFLLDDLRADQVAFLPTAAERLAGVEFTRAYATTPLCAPTRASLLSGGWAPSATGVLTNDAPYGGAARFAGPDALAVRLQEAGYATALFGKYLNGYDALAPYVPPGWTAWGVPLDGAGWTDFSLVSGSAGPTSAETGRVDRYLGYVTDWQTSAATAFLEAHPDEPVFLYVPYLAPHHPFEPADEDDGAYTGTEWRTGAYGEPDVSDKPAWVRALPEWSDADAARLDANNASRLESLLAVDRSIDAIIDAVEASPRAGRTVFVLTSDNGSLWGEHRMNGKAVAYEESARVPLLIAGPGVPARQLSGLVAMNLDLGATLQALAGLPVTGDGAPLLDALCDDSAPLRDRLVLESWPSEHPGWAALVQEGQKYVETATAERELYDAGLDPWEEASRHADPALAATIAEAAAELAASRALAVADLPLAAGRVGVPYEVALAHHGGVEPLTWTLTKGELPPGLTLEAGGWLTGTPTQEAEAQFTVEVQDASASAYDGEPERAWQTLQVVIGPAPAPPPEPECGCGSEGPGGWSLVVGLVALLRRPLRAARRGPSDPGQDPTRILPHPPVARSRPERRSTR